MHCLQNAEGLPTSSIACEEGQLLRLAVSAIREGTANKLHCVPLFRQFLFPQANKLHIVRAGGQGEDKLQIEDALQCVLPGEQGRKQ